MNTTTEKPNAKAMLGKVLNVSIALLSSLSFYGIALMLLTFVLSLFNQGIHADSPHNINSIALLLVIISVCQLVLAGILKAINLPVALIGRLTLKKLITNYTVIAIVLAASNAIFDALFSSSPMLLNIMTLAVIVVCFVCAITFEKDRRGLAPIGKETTAK